jgi:alpha-1,2-mannosyltransferase
VAGVTAREIGLCVALAAAVAGVVWWRAPARVHSDFCSYYAAGRLTLEGRGVEAYDPAALEAAHRAIHDVGRRAGPYLYSPLLLVPSAAFALLPLPAAEAANRALGAVALGGGLLAVLLALGGWPERCATALAFGLSHPVAAQLAYENWTFLLFALLAVAALAARRERPVWAGLAAAAAVHLKAFTVFTLAPLIGGRRRRVVLWATLLAALLLAASIPVVGGRSWITYGEMLASTGGAGVTPYYNKCSLAANLARLSTGPRDWVAARGPVGTWPVRSAFWIGLPLLAWGSWRLRRSPEAGLAFGIGWTLLFVPQIWEHTEILLFAAVPALASRWRWPVLALLAATCFYGGLQQGLLRDVLAATRPPLSLAALLLLYPSLNLLVLAAALAGDAGGNAGAARARA